MDPSRYLELPWALAELEAQPRGRVLDLAGPKLLACALARAGFDVTSVDLLPSEVEAWRRLTAGMPRLRLEVADGRELPFADSSFDHAVSVSVLEHIPEPGDEQALRELARVTRPGGRVLVTLPHAPGYREEWRDEPVYGVETQGPGARYLFQRLYDPPRVDRLAAAAPALELVSREVVRMQPNWNAAYVATFPLLLPLGPFFGLLARERAGPRGDVVRLGFVRRGAAIGL
jgi:SAM-dependent methyltransferase